MTEALYYILSNDADVAFFVSTRIYPLRIPLNIPYPAITFEVVSDVPQNSKTGVANYYNTRVQVNCFAVDATAYSGYERAKVISGHVQDALERITPTTIAGVEIKNITLLSERDFAFDFGDYECVFQRALDFNICYEK